ncbi:hypothetical protein C0991_001348, partial [Blastosporella zonata]
MSSAMAESAGKSLLRIPKLEVNGSNWVVYKDCFQWATDACGLLKHVDGTETEPTDPIPKETQKNKATLTTTEQKAEEDWLKEMK